MFIVAEGLLNLYMNCSSGIFTTREKAKQLIVRGLTGAQRVFSYGFRLLLAQWQVEAEAAFLIEHALHFDPAAP